MSTPSPDALRRPPDHTPDGAPLLRRRPAPEQFAHIAGWGADLDKANRPAIPMERTPPRLDDAPVSRPALQPADVEILCSTERPGLTPLFGSAVPPAGLSGVLRRRAYRFSENDLRRWLVLLVADRVDVVEGLVSDLAHGHVPNVYREMGGRAERRHNPRGAARKALTIAAIAGAAVYLWSRRGRSPLRRD